MDQTVESNGIQWNPMESNGIQPSDGHDPRPLNTVAAQVAIVWTATSAPCDVRPHLKHL